MPSHLRINTDLQPRSSANARSLSVRATLIAVIVLGSSSAASISDGQTLKLAGPDSRVLAPVPGQAPRPTLKLVEVADDAVELQAATIPAGLAPNATLDQVYAFANKAKTLDEMQSIIDACQELMTKDLDEGQQLHASRLQAWAAYQSGELYLDRAAALNSDLETAKANELLDADQTPEDTDSIRTEIETNVDLALTSFRSSHQADPAFNRSRYGMGVSYCMQGKYQQAVDCFQLVVEQNPKFAEAHLNLAECLLHMGEAEKALASFDAGVTLRPQDPGAYSSRGHAYMTLGQPKKALQDYKRCVQLLPDNAQALLNRGDAFREVGEWEKALDDYMAARKRAVQSPIPCQRMSWMLATCPDLKLRNEGAAYELAVQAIQLRGRANAQLLDTLAAAQAANGWYEEAHQTLSKIEMIDPAGFSSDVEKRVELYQARQAFVDELRR